MARIRLQSFPPLPSLKAWFLIPPGVTNIRDLKLALCSQLSIFKDMRIEPAHIVLEMDGFEVLEESHVDLVHEGDVMLYAFTILASLNNLSKKPVQAQASENCCFRAAIWQATTLAG